MPTTTLGRNATGLRGRNNLVVRIGRGFTPRSVSFPMPDDGEIVWSVPGGDDTFSCTVPWPDRGIARPEAFTQNQPVRVEDRRTGEIIWQGRLADPGFTGDRAQQDFRLNAAGSVHDLDMMSVVKLYVDRDPDHWFDLHTWPSGLLNKGDGTGFIASVHDSLQIPPEYYLEMPWPANTFQATGANQSMAYLIGLYAAQDLQTADGSVASLGPFGGMPEVHGIRFSWISSFANANDMKVDGASPDAGSTTTLFSTPWTTGGQHDVSIRDGLSAWTRNDFTFFYIRQDRTGGNITSSGGDGYIRFSNIHVLGKRYDRYSNDVTGVRLEALAPYEVFEDMLGTVLNNKFDAGYIFKDTSVLIDHFTYWNPSPVSAILDDADAWNNDTWWGVWAPANQGSRPRLEYRSWNVLPRYTLNDTAHVELAGGAEQWANSALVTYLRGNGVPTVTRVTITVPQISRVFGSTGAGTLAKNTRDLSVDLTDRGSLTRAKAVDIVGAMLYASATDRESGSAVVSGPIMDETQGRLVQPWEIRPGWPIRVESTPNGYTAGVGGANAVYDGESTFRLTKVTYRVGDDTAALEFDGGSRRLYKGRAHRQAPKYTYTRWAQRQRKR
jgi:hypothetical protein